MINQKNLKKYSTHKIDGEKTCIGILSSHDDKDKNNRLVLLLEEFLNQEETILKNYTLVFTGGTYDRVITGFSEEKEEEKYLPNRPIKNKYYEKLMEHCGVIRLSKRSEGGVTLLSDLVVKQCISVLWFFLSSKTHHWLIPENLALMRLCEQWSVKKLITWGSILEWIKFHAPYDQRLNAIKMKDEFKNNKFKDSDIEESDVLESYTLTQRTKFENKYEIDKKTRDWENKEDLNKDLDPIKTLENFENLDKIYSTTIALIAHDAMKEKMKEFAIHYERELKNFDKIIATSTTGKELLDAVPGLKEKDKGKVKDKDEEKDRLVRFHSGTKGGDIEISAEILKGDCKIVVFFIDPLFAHPHIDDIRTVFSICMIQDDILMLTNEWCAREWFDVRLKSRQPIP